MCPRPLPARLGQDDDDPGRMLLAIATVDRSGSACVLDDAGRELAFADLAGAPTEAQLVPLIDRLITDHGRPDRLAVAVGPGSFTGLRTGITAVRTLAWLEQVAVYPVDSLAATAVMAGDGCWWVLLPLKKDTTFHGIFRVYGDRIETVLASVAIEDSAPPPVLPDDAIALGPGIIAKPVLLHGRRSGNPASPNARGVARLAVSAASAASAVSPSPVPWDRLLPVYGQEPAPVLQRQRGQS